MKDTLYEIGANIDDIAVTITRAHSLVGFMTDYFGETDPDEAVLKLRYQMYGDMNGAVLMLLHDGLRDMENISQAAFGAWKSEMENPPAKKEDRPWEAMNEIHRLLLGIKEVESLLCESREKINSSNQFERDLANNQISCAHELYSRLVPEAIAYVEKAFTDIWGAQS